MSEPFMEHPSGEFETCLAALASAVTRLRALPKWEEWIIFGAQGEGARPESYHFAEIRMLGDTLDVGEAPLDIAKILKKAQAGNASLEPQGSHYVLTASPKECARILDAIFRHHLGIRPFADEGDDYAVGAEW